MGNMSPPSLDHASEVITISTQILIGTIMAIFFAVVIAFFIYLYAKFYWSNNVEDHSIVLWRRRLARQRRTTPARLNRQGLDPTVVKSLQQVVYDSKDFNEGLECAVCLSEVSQGEKVRLLPKCNHGFHVDCIDMWFQSHSTCPLCRTPVIDTPTTSSNDTINNSQLLDDDHSNSNSSPRNREVIQVFPENVVFWGNETQISTFGQVASGSASTSATSTGVNRLRNQEMVIEIPPSSHGLCEDCLSSPPPLEEGKTPVMTRLGSLKRLWSFGKKGASPSPRASSSSNVDHQA